MFYTLDYLIQCSGIIVTAVSQAFSGKRMGTAGNSGFLITGPVGIDKRIYDGDPWKGRDTSDSMVQPPYISYKRKKKYADLIWFRTSCRCAKVVKSHR